MILWISFLQDCSLRSLNSALPFTAIPNPLSTHAVYDSSELVLYSLDLGLTVPQTRFRKNNPVAAFIASQTIFLLIKSVTTVSVTFGISAEVIESALAGGNPVNSSQVSCFQLVLGIASVVIFILIKKRTIIIFSNRRYGNFKLEAGYWL